MRASVLLLFILPIVAYGEYTSLSSATVESAKTDIKALYSSNADTMATGLRLAFHDCVGNCDGCINLDNHHNNGLANIITLLDTIYVGGYDAYMSRADFWALAGIASVEQGLEFNSKLDCGDFCMPDETGITFQWGRKDCDSSPSTDETHDFPDPNMTQDENIAFFASEFGFDEQETTAIMGAHTLGGGEAKNTGYLGPWMNGEKFAFNNKYYWLIVDDSSTVWTNVNVKNDRNPVWQWKGHDTDGNLLSALMLNTDMSLYKVLTLDSDGAATCDWDTTCPASGAATYVETYATDPTKFMEDFAAAYVKMTQNGYDSLNDLS